MLSASIVGANDCSGSGGCLCLSDLKTSGVSLRTVLSEAMTWITAFTLFSIIFVLMLERSFPDDKVYASLIIRQLLTEGVWIGGRSFETSQISTDDSRERGPCSIRTDQNVHGNDRKVNLTLPVCIQN